MQWLDVDGTVLVGTAITPGGASGIVSATSFYGDGSNLEGVASVGLGTALLKRVQDQLSITPIIFLESVARWLLPSQRGLMWHIHNMPKFLLMKT